MIDHMPAASTMNVLGRVGSSGGEFGCAQLTRRLSCHHSMGAARKTSLARQLMRYSRSNQNLAASESPTFLAKRATRKLSSALVADLAVDSNKRPQLSSVRAYIEEKARLVNCSDIYICDGSERERKELIQMMADKGMLVPLKKYENCWLARTDPRDVARVESKTFICSRRREDVVPRGAEAGSTLGNWMHLDELDALMAKRLAGCMAGRTLYVIPFSMGPLGSNLSKVGIQLTDSPYVVVSMHIMTRVSRQVFEIIAQQPQQQEDFVRCFHTSGCPLPLQRPLVNQWPCNPEETIISHIPERKEIISYGSGYGGNSLLGKKCFALRLGSIMGRQEGWLAEHMLILGVTNPQGVKRYIAAAFPSACGKTNLAMMTPTLPGYKIECVGDDIAWMRFDENGRLRAINPEAGFFGVAPGTNHQSNPNAMRTIERNTIFTNVAHLEAEGDFYWEGLEERLQPGTKVRDWLGESHTISEDQPKDRKFAHPNSRFCAPASQCPIIDPQWESPEGVPIEAIIFGGRRPEGVPLVYEAFDWSHGVYVGASMRSESTAAAEHAAGKTIMHDPFAMRPFFGYNFGHYLQHWLSFAHQPGLKLPKIFHVNWFRRDQATGKFLWPGFGENSRVLDWICRRVAGEACATPTPLGLIPSEGSLNLEGLKGDDEVNLEELFSISRDFWLEEQATVEKYLVSNVGQDLPQAIKEESDKLRMRLLS